MTLLLHQLTFEQRVFRRSREAAVFIFIFPLLLYALLGSVYDGEIDGAPAVDVLLAGLFGYGAANTALAGLAIILVGRREAGVLKRLRATPLPPATYMAAVLSRCWSSSPCRRGWSHSAPRSAAQPRPRTGSGS